MEVFGIPFQELVFSIFLPFLLFYLLFYALLRKSKILGDAKNLDAMTALVLSAIVIFSAYASGIINYMATIGVGIAIASFVAIFIFGTMSTAAHKIKSYRTGEAFKTEDEKKFDAAKENANRIWEKIKKSIPKVDPSDLNQLQGQIKILEELASKLHKDLDIELPWYVEYKQLLKELAKGG